MEIQSLPMDHAGDTGDDKSSAETRERKINTVLYSGPDRRDPAMRREPLSFFSLRQLSFRAERHSSGRRAEDAWDDPYVDWYPPHLLWLVAGVVLLAAIDAYLTLELWAVGEFKLNPLMASLVDSDPLKYVLVKVGIASLALSLLVIYKNFPVYRVCRVGQLIYVLFAAYLVLVGAGAYAWFSLGS